MAQTQMCSSEDGNAAVMLVSNLENGETEAWCADCLPIFAMATLGITPEVFRAAIEAMPDEPVELPGGDPEHNPDEDDTDGGPKSEAENATPAPESVEEPTTTG